MKADFSNDSITETTIKLTAGGLLESSMFTVHVVVLK